VPADADEIANAKSVDPDANEMAVDSNADAAAEP